MGHYTEKKFCADKFLLDTHRTHFHIKEVCMLSIEDVHKKIDIPSLFAQETHNTLVAYNMIYSAFTTT